MTAKLSNVLEGLMILDRYQDEYEKPFVTYTDRSAIYVAGPSKDRIAVLDAQELDELGWYYIRFSKEWVIDT